jgi:Ca2+-binding EF-hand superfamily protein
MARGLRVSWRGNSPLSRLQGDDFMKKVVTLIACAALVPVAGVAVAGEGQKDHGKTFSTLDVNGDGRISVNEAAVDAQFSDRFATADMNRDGYVDEQEYTHAAASAPPKAPAG